MLEHQHPEQWNVAQVAEWVSLVLNKTEYNNLINTNKIRGIILLKMTRLKDWESLGFQKLYDCNILLHSVKLLNQEVENIYGITTINDITADKVTTSKKPDLEKLFTMADPKYSLLIYPVFQIPQTFLKITCDYSPGKIINPVAYQVLGERNSENLTAVQQKTILYFTNEGSQVINSALLANGLLKSKEFNNIQLLFTACRDASQKKLPGLVARVMTMTMAQLSKYVLGLEFFWPPFVSTSVSKVNWKGNVVVIIKLQPGMRRFAVSTQSTNAGGDEILLCAYSKYKVIGTLGNPSLPCIVLKYLDWAPPALNEIYFDEPLKGECSIL